MSAQDKTKLTYWIAGLLVAVCFFVVKSYAADIKENSNCIQKVKEAHNSDIKRIETGQAVIINELKHIRRAVEIN